MPKEFSSSIKIWLKELLLVNKDDFSKFKKIVFLIHLSYEYN